MAERLTVDQEVVGSTPISLPLNLNIRTLFSHRLKILGICTPL